MRYLTTAVVAAIMATAMFTAGRPAEQAEVCPLIRVDRQINLNKKPLGAASGSDVIDDRAMIAALHKEADRIMEDKDAKTKVTDGKTLAEQLKRAKADVALPGDAALCDTPAELYAKAKPGVLVLGGVFKCGKCEHWHVAPASGFIISADGLAVTNYHVMNEPEQAGFIAMTGDGRVAMVKEVVAADEAADVAIIRLEGEGFTPLPMTADAPVGSGVRVISHPDGQFYTLTSGIVSRYAKVTEADNKVAERVYITADFARGSSGGPVFDEKGRVIGLVASTESIYYNDEDGEQKNLQMVMKMCVPSRSVLNLIGK